MTEQPEALRLAQELDAYHTRSCHKEAARLLREQHAEIERLRAEILTARDAGYEKGVTDTLLDYGVDL